MTSVQTLTLTDFLLARIAEDEAGARKAFGRSWETVKGSVIWSGQRPIAECDSTADGLFIARHNPARVLADCAARRRIVDLHHEYLSICTHCVQVHAPHDREQWPCESLRLLAVTYADHPDYREEWRP